MKRIVPCVSLLFVVALCSEAFSLDGWAGFFGLRHCWPNYVSKACCDDYCPKTLPHVCPVDRFCCDDYCPKALPCTKPVTCFCCDDYCPKGLQLPSCLPCQDLKCPPPQSCCPDVGPPKALTIRPK